ncbi:MAG TPA: hydrogenase expression/formation protein HypE [Bacteroidales bacterium]|nr:hydrogenase expression/formation protein HypE [Bacteroidales bacterium]HPE56735.1 hydrogenase expression/formation protein HypE [Bacteroidales bacterium]HRX96678.1 hydrogenase expression/formation protein HypE [Bacteroidales bacterium]
MTKNILLGHGSGGKLSHDLITNLFVKYFHNDILDQQTDASVLKPGSELISFTTDSFVVDPIFFPGGNIGKLAIAGTVNDLAVSGAKPLYLSASFIIEEGLPFKDLEEIVKTMSEEAEKAGVKIVTGDTKVVDRGKCDKVFINTTGVGALDIKRQKIGLGTEIKAGDKVIINGTLADHGMCIMSVREGLGFQAEIESDCASLNRMIGEVLEVSEQVKFMRDATRGGLATVLCELAESRKLGFEIDESKVPVKENVRGICELLGFDPLYVANEGKVLMIVGNNDAEKVLETLKKNEFGKEAAIIGEVTDEHHGKAWITTGIGGRRIIDMLAGEQLPRIC